MAISVSSAVVSIEELRRLFARPFEEHPDMERLAEPPSASAREISVSCSS